MISQDDYNSLLESLYLAGIKGVYEDIPNILYALLLYITGAEGAGDIKIAGLSLDDLTT